MFKLTIDGKTVIVRSTKERLHKAMWSYLRKERAKGRRLAEIQFCWTPITVSNL